MHFLLWGAADARIVFASNRKFNHLYKENMSVQVCPSHFALLVTIGAGLTSALVVRTSGAGEVKIEEVKVSYGDELEGILHKAASDGNLGLVREIFNNEVINVLTNDRLSNFFPNQKFPIL